MLNNNYISWVDFFEGPEPNEKITNVQQNHTQITSTLNSYVTEALFINLRSPEKYYGGAIYYSYRSSSDYSSFLIENSLFENCVSSYYYGGAIYCQSRGSFAINKCCSSHCHVDDDSCYAQFVHVNLNTLIELFCIISDSSIIYSNPTCEESYNTIELIGSNFTTKSSNISFNTCNSVSGLSCRISTIKVGDPGIAIYNYLILANNTANLRFLLEYTGKNYYLRNTNIINNIQVDWENYGIIGCSLSTNLTIEQCCIINNDVKYAVYVGIGS